MSVRIENNQLHIFNPGTGESLDMIPITSPDEMETILALSQDAARTWNQSSLSHRGNIITDFRKAIVHRLDDFISVICSETGKKSFEALLEVFTSVEHMKRSVPMAKSVLRKEKRKTGIMITKRGYVQYEPMGVAGIISPWNYPLILTLTPVVEALLAGNTVVLKPSEQTPLTTRLLKEIWDEIVSDKDILQVVYGSGETGRHLVTSEKTNIICFTGSTAIGRIIAQDCAPLFKPVILELGGKDPMLVFDDADLSRAAHAAVWGGMSNAGQTCISVERIYVHEKVLPKFITTVSNMIKSLSAGSGKDSAVGAISVSNSFEKIKNQIDNVRSKVGIIEGTADESNLFIPPTMVIDAPDDSSIMREETFGPVITIKKFTTDDEAVKFANNTGYGLSAAVFSRNRSRARRIASRIRAGSVSINDVLTHYGIADLPFGGVGLSGIGRVHGPEGLRAFSHQKSIMENRINLKMEYWWYGKSHKIEGTFKKFIRWFYG